jgi:hypothetical protein
VRGIISAAGYVPYRRLQRSEIAAFFGAGGGRGTRSVACYDEDTTTMGVEAARATLRATEARPAALWFATADPAYLEKTIAHENAVRARIEPTTLEILEIEATARALPWVECEVAPVRARRLVGLPLSGLRSNVRASFTGTLTCTHLNDTLRSLEDVVALAARLPRAPGAGCAGALSGLRDSCTDGRPTGGGST